MKLGKLQSVIPNQVHRFFQQDFFPLQAAILGLCPGGQYPESIGGLLLHDKGEGLLAGLGNGLLLHHSPIQQKLNLAGQEGIIFIFQLELELHFLGVQLVGGLVFLNRWSGLYHLYPQFMVGFQ